MAGIGSVVINFTASTRDAVRDIGRLNDRLDATERKAGRLGGVLKNSLKAGVVGVGAAAAGAAVGLVQFVEAAIDDADAAAKLATVLKKVTKATDADTDAVEAWITQRALATGVADDKLRPALTRLVRSTKNVTRAQKLMDLALDIAAGTGKDAVTVAAALAKANDGNVGALKKLGISLGDSAENAVEHQKQLDRLVQLQHAATTAYRESGAGSKEYQKAAAKVADQQERVNTLVAAGVDWQKELREEFAGSAAEAAGTARGTWERIKLVFGELGESIGSFALPMLSELEDWMADPKHIAQLQEWIDKVGGWAQTIGEDLRDKLVEFIDWVKSPEGKKAIDDFGGKLQDVLDVVNGLVTALGKLKELWDWYIGADKQGRAENPKDFFTGQGGGTANDAPGSHLNPDQGKAYRPKVPRNAAAAGYRSGGVVININNPKAERASDSIAASLRASRGVWI